MQYSFIWIIEYSQEACFIVKAFLNFFINEN